MSRKSYAYRKTSRAALHFTKNTGRATIVVAKNRRDSNAIPKEACLAWINFNFSHPPRCSLAKM